ncbi:MAG: hypothetical protein ACK5Q5_00070 [Planctomycetaceae bacterium]
MDCRQALTLLEAGRPDRSDWDAPELDAAAQHVDHCEDCQTVLANREQWDALLTEAFQSVAIPAGLTDRLLAAVELSPASVTAPAAPAVLPRRSRRWFGWITAAVALIAVGLVSWRMGSGGMPSIALADLYQQVDQQLLEATSSEQQRPFSGDFNSLPSDPIWREAVAGRSPVGLDFDGQPGSEAAAYRFTAGRLAGWLIVLPRERVHSPPVEEIPVHANFQYGAHPRVAWTTGEMVYVCVLDSGHSLDDLRRTFYGSAA